MTSTGAIISMKGVRLGYGAHVVLPRVDLEVEAGDFLAIVGRTARGRRRFLRAILVCSGHGGRDARAQGVRLLAPEARARHDLPFTVEEVVAMGLQGERPPLSRLTESHRERIEKALAACGVEKLAQRPFRDLSGGQQQRSLVARALVSDPQVLVLDEPTNDLDLSGEHDIMELVAQVNRSGRTVVMVSHLLNLVAHYATRVAILHEGQLDAGPASEVLTSERLSKLYGIPVSAGEIDGRRAILPKVEARP